MLVHFIFACNFLKSKTRHKFISLEHLYTIYI